MILVAFAKDVMDGRPFLIERTEDLRDGGAIGVSKRKAVALDENAKNRRERGFEQCAIRSRRAVKR